MADADIVNDATDQGVDWGERTKQYTVKAAARLLDTDFPTVLKWYSKVEKDRLALTAAASISEADWQAIYMAAPHRLPEAVALARAQTTLANLATALAQIDVDKAQVAAG